MAKYQSKHGKYEIEKLDDVELSPELDEKVEKMTAQADSDIEVRVNLRWSKEQLSLVKQASAFMGVPYQTYMKMVVFQHAVSDVQAFKALKDRK